MDVPGLLFLGALLFSLTFFNARHRAKYEETFAFEHCYSTNTARYTILVVHHTVTRATV